MRGFLAFLFFIIPFHSVFSQVQIKDSLWHRSVLDFQSALDHEYKDTVTSPLNDDDAIKFSGHEFCSPDQRFCVKATLKRSKGEKPFQIATSSNRTKEYIKYGVLHFELLGRKCQLTVYQSIALKKRKEYKKHLLLMFTDLTTGEETYGGGRYIDLEIPKGKELVLDFNLAYYPYCAYTTGYSCPIPPAENFLDVKVEAGIRGQEQELKK